MFFHTPLLVLLVSILLGPSVYSFPLNTKTKQPYSLLDLRWPAESPARVVPAVKDIEKQLHFEPNTALFWSGDRKEAAEYAEKHGLKTMDMAISGDTPWNTDWLKDPKIRDEYWDRASVAMVNVISGTAHVMLRGGKDDPITYPGTVWTREEWPYLKAGTNPKVDKVIRINPAGDVVGQIWP